MGCGASSPAPAPVAAGTPPAEARSQAPAPVPAPAPAATEPAPAPPPAEPVKPKDPKEVWPAKIAGLLKGNPDNICLNTFDVTYFNSLSDDLKPDFIKCLASGIENPDSGMGCYACQPADYDRFKPFFSKALAKYHKVAEDAKHVNNWSLDGVEGLPEGGVLDISKLGLPELSMRVRVGRNLKEFPLPGAMTQEDRCNLENRMLAAFEVLFKDPAYGGKYCSFTPGHANFVDEAEYQALVDAHIAFKDMSADPYLLSAGIAQHWPYGRGVYISEDKGFIIWVGEEDHLRIMCMKKGTILNEVFDRLKGALDVVNGIESIGGFAMSDDYGVVTSCPTNLGTGMRASLHIQLPNLTSDGTDAKAKSIAKPLGLSVRGLGGEHTPIGADGTVDISPSARFCITEAQIITALYKGIELLKKAEDEAGGGAPAAEPEA
jgi:protein-arginine kinase